jgi:hypothetical protein
LKPKLAQYAIISFQKINFIKHSFYGDGATYFLTPFRISPFLQKKCCFIFTADVKFNKNIKLGKEFFFFIIKTHFNKGDYP